MRDLNELNKLRLCNAYVKANFGSFGDGGNGIFMVSSSVDHRPLRIIASNQGGWDHVSVSREDRIPLWTEMEQVKRLFFKDDETAMQLHVPPSEHINVHPNCLHLWRANLGPPLVLPPSFMVG